MHIYHVELAVFGPFSLPLETYCGATDRLHDEGHSRWRTDKRIVIAVAVAPHLLALSYNHRRVTTIMCESARVYGSVLSVKCRTLSTNHYPPSALSTLLTHSVHIFYSKCFEHSVHYKTLGTKETLGTHAPYILLCVRGQSWPTLRFGRETHPHRENPLLSSGW
jgi:hypothetical protein